ncbi:MAG: UDP-N-acetylmuramoyl-tripeptide--D-alanyl-D-alanine ligase, partial [Peptococcaceae bacterium]|nr:UDP-N-acetylmuramoyl-tripeptide--D-alanyl-D-alanine ligase [Peptococcaceae bacterium]
KCELLAYIPSDGAAVLNSSDRALIAPWLDTCKGRIVWYDGTGLDKNAEYRAENIIQHAEGITYELHAGDHSEKIHLAVHGVHNVSNSMAAIAIAREVGVDWKSIVSALAQAKLTGMRLDITKNADGVTVINDAYNANPDSMKSAISVLMNQEGSRKIAVLGDMYELGKYEEQSHREVGNEAAVQHVDYLIAVGQLGALIGESAQMAGCRVDFAKDNAEASSLLRQYIKTGDAVLVKGSRGMKMEQIVQSLMG